MTDPSPPFDPDATQPVPGRAQPVNPVPALAAGGPPSLGHTRGGAGHEDAPPAPLVPGAPLAYSTPRVIGRPGILTALGVMSIIVASLSALSSLSTGFQAVLFGVMIPKMSARMTTTVSPTTVTTTSSGTSVSTSVVVSPIGSGTPATTATAAGGTGTPTGGITLPVVPLTAAEAKSVVQRVQARLSNSMTPAQVTALTTALQGTSPQLVPPAYVYSPVQTATQDSAGTVDITFTGGSGITITSGGAVTSQTAATTGAPFPFSGMSKAAVLVNLGEAVASLALAVALLVAGILVFRNSARARWLHARYALLKLPVAAVGAVGAALFYGGLLSNLGATPTRGSLLYIEAIYFGMWLAIGCAYPIAVLIVLRTKTVRGYYHGVAAG